MPRPGIIPARNHWCLHNDQLAQEFDGILNLTPTFPGCAKSPEGSIFYAPLSSNLDEVVAGLTPNYIRDLEGLYEPTPGQWAIAADGVPRFESGYLLMEPAATNKNLNYNANPDAALTGILTSGDPNVVVTRAQDTQRLDNAGLNAICTSGYVIDVDNSAGTGFAQCYIDGPCGNTNVHSWSMWARSLNGLCRVQSTNGQQVVEVTSTEEYERFSVIGANSVGGAFLSLYVAAGAHGRFVLNGLVEESILSTPIITRGASASRGVDRLHYDLAPDYNDAEGSLQFDFVLLWDEAQYPGSNRFLVSLNNVSSADLAYLGLSTAVDLRTYDGANLANLRFVEPVVNGRTYQGFVRWTTIGGVQQVAIKENGVWAYGVEQTYKGSHTTGGPPDRHKLFAGSTPPVRLGNVTFWDYDLGTPPGA